MSQFSELLNQKRDGRITAYQAACMLNYNSLLDTNCLAVMKLILHNIEADYGLKSATTFRRDLHLDFHADYVLANPPFNESDWFRNWLKLGVAGLDDDSRDGLQAVRGLRIQESAFTDDGSRMAWRVLKKLDEGCRLETPAPRRGRRGACRV